MGVGIGLDYNTARLYPPGSNRMLCRRVMSRAALARLVYQTPLSFVRSAHSAATFRICRFVDANPLNTNLRVAYREILGTLPGGLMRLKQWVIGLAIAVVAMGAPPSSRRRAAPGHATRIVDHAQHANQRKWQAWGDVQGLSKFYGLREVERSRSPANVSALARPPG